MQVWIDVETDQPARWSATITKLVAPSKPVTSFSEKGTGAHSTALHRLEKGHYAFTFTYSGNTDQWGDMDLFAWVGSPSGTIVSHLVWDEESATGSRNVAVLLDQAEVVWVDVAWAAPGAKWSVSEKVIEETFSTAPKPTIAGTVKAGSTLTAKAGTWKPKPTLTYQWYRDGAKISGATKSTYKPTSSDCGKPLTVKVTGKKSGYKTKTVTSAATKKVACSAFTTKPAPTIAGTAKAGSTLTAKPGTWKPKPTLTYQWYRGTSKIKGATKSTYKPTSSDCGKPLTVKVTGKKGGYTTKTVTSKATKKVACSTFSSTPKPKISGTAAIGKTLTAKAGTWKPKPKLTYQWYRGTSKIKGATKSTYKPVVADCGKSLSVKVTGKKATYKSVTTTSKATKKVACPSFSATPTPTISGTATVGSKLTAKAGTWKPTATLAYQWMRDGKKISGATKSTYTLVPADRGKAISVKVTGSRAGYASVTKTSKATAKVAPGTFTSAPGPGIGGEPVVDGTLVVYSRDWRPEPTTREYQWLRDGKAIDGATGLAYDPVPGDFGTMISVTMTGTRDGYETTSATSVAVGPIEAGQLDSQWTPLTIEGEPVVGSELRIDPSGVWYPEPDRFEYQWFRNYLDPIDGATDASYLLTEDDLGATISAEVTAIKFGYHPRTSRTMNQTEAVRAAGE